MVVGGAGNDLLTGLGRFSTTSALEDDVLYGGPGTDRFDFVYKNNQYNSRGNKAQIMDFTPGVDQLGFAPGISADDIVFRYNGAYTEVVDTRGLAAEVVRAIENAVGIPLGDIANGGLFNREIGALYSSQGAGRASDFTDFLSLGSPQLNATFVNTRGIA